MIQQHGLLVVNKPGGISSAQCTNRLKRLGQKKIGHAGTLDPMAQGVLLVLLGHATKISGYLMAGGAKTYAATVLLGQTTDTWDTDGQTVTEAPWHDVSEAAVRTVVASWLGRSEQQVPPYSAAKHQGQPLYKLSRAGKETPVKIKTIDISQAEVLRVALPLVSFRITCSSGTYIRSLAHSLGMRLGCGAVLTELIREYSHPFGLDSAHDLDAIMDAPQALPDLVLPVTQALPHWGTVTLDAEQTKAVRNGHAIAADRAPRVALAPGMDADNAVLLDPDGQPLALATLGAAAHTGNGPVWSVLRGLWHEPNPSGG